MSREFRAKLKPNPSVGVISKIRDELLRQYTWRYGVETGVDLVLSAESTEEFYEITLSAVPKRCVLVAPEQSEDEREKFHKELKESMNAASIEFIPVPPDTSRVKEFFKKIEDDICRASMVPKHLLYGDPEQLKTCRCCKAKFIPSETASEKEMCHACIMASL
jgi:hypothetical protein